MREAHRSFRATTQKRRKFVPRASSTVLGTPDALGQRSGVVQDRLGTGLGMLLDGARALLACPGRPKIGPRVFFWRPSPFWSASWRVPQMALSAQERPRPKFHRFFTDFRRFFVHFCSILALSGTLVKPTCDRACYSFGVTKRSRAHVRTSVNRAFLRAQHRSNMQAPPSSN